nr:MAG: putative capsid protein [Arizlama virus]
MPFASYRRRRRVISGRGAYTSRYGTRLSGRGAYSYKNPGPVGKVGRTIGAMIGSRYAGPLGSWLGNRIGGLVHYPAKLFGSGAYRRRRNTGHGSGAYSFTGSGKMAPQVPEFINNADDSITICHREYICDIITHSTPGLFQVQDFYINPGSSLFPWLSTLVQTSYQQYQFSSLVFAFKSSSADSLNSTNTQLGTVIAAINYDATDQPYATRIELENTQWSQSLKPSADALIPVECATKQTFAKGLLYVLNAFQVPEGADPKLYYLGRLSIATIGFQAASVKIGSLYATYKVKLYKPVMLKPLAQGMQTSLARSGAAAATPLGTATVANIYNCNSLNIRISTATGQTITFDKSRLQIGTRIVLVWRFTGSGSVTCTYPAITSSGFAGLSMFSHGATGAPHDGAFWLSPYTGEAGTMMLMVYYFEVSGIDTDPWIKFGNGGNLPTSFICCDLQIQQFCGTRLDFIGGEVNCGP